MSQSYPPNPPPYTPPPQQPYYTPQPYYPPLPQEYYPPPPQNYPPPAPRRSGCVIVLAILGILLVVGCCLVCAVGGAGYYFWSTGAFDQRQLSTLVGRGAGEISVINASSEAISVTAHGIDSQGESMLGDYIEPRPNEVDGFMEPPGRYQLEFTNNSGSLATTCILELAVNDLYMFTVVDVGVVVMKQGYEPGQVSESDVQTSSLCQK